MKKIISAIILVLLFATNAYASLQFDGVNDYVLIPDSDNWNFGSNNFTIEFWARLNDTTTNNSIFLTSSTMWIYYAPGINSGLTFRAYNGFVAVVDECQGSMTGWSPSTWYHIGVTRNGNNWGLYRNGVKIGGDVNGNAIPNDGGFKVGVMSNLTQFYNGSMDELRIWNIGMTESDIQYYMNNSPDPSDSRLLGYWDMELNDQRIVHDLTHYGNNGQLNGYPPVPEPATMFLLLLGLGGLRFLRGGKVKLVPSYKGTPCNILEHSSE